MKIKLMNSAMMPCEGVYINTKITKEDFINIIKENCNNIESYIGYQENINLIKDWTGVEFPFNRGTTTVEDGDQLLVMKLNKRIGDPSMKGKVTFEEDDFEFYLVQYQSMKLRGEV